MLPVMVNVKAAPPAFTGFGLREIMVGTGLGGGGGGLPELPDPLPPQPEKNAPKTRHSRVSILLTVPPGGNSLGPFRRIGLNVAPRINSFYELPGEVSSLCLDHRIPHISPTQSDSDEPAVFVL